jgi:hypothetical protein
VKVGELEEGMLVKASGNWEIVDCGWPTFLRTKNKKTFKRVEKGSIGITVTHAYKRKAKKDIMMFVGTTQDNFQWGGVLRHHRFLWNGKGVIMTGYDMRYLEPIKVAK